jgi:hypothetical protein
MGAKVNATSTIEVMLIFLGLRGRRCSAGRDYGVFSGLCFGLLCYRRGLCNGQRHASKLSTAGYSHTPCQSGTVSRAFFSHLHTRSTVWAASIAFYLTFLARKAVVGGSGSWCSSSSFPGGSGGGDIVGGSGGRALHFLSLGGLGSWRDGHGGWYKRGSVNTVLYSVASAGC